VILVFEFLEAAESFAHRILVIGNPLTNTNFFYRGCKAGDLQNPSVLLLAAWFRQQLECPVTLEHRDDSVGVKAVYLVRLTREDSSIEILRDQSNIAVLSQTNQPPKELSLPVRSLRDCLAEDLRRLDPDLAYEKVICSGLEILLGEQV
jgi:glucose-6-phosphate dehydrogenase assembly protein OpcA